MLDTQALQADRPGICILVINNRGSLGRLLYLFEPQIHYLQNKNCIYLLHKLACGLDEIIYYVKCILCTLNEALVNSSHLFFYYSVKTQLSSSDFKQTY